MGREIISGIGFLLKQGQWVKVSSSKNADTLVAPDDNRMLNDVYSEEELPDFRLGTRPRAPRRAAATPAAAAAAPQAAEAPPTAAASSQDDAAADPAMPPAASAVPEDHFQQLLDRVDVLSHQQQQLQSDFVTFRQQFQISRWSYWLGSVVFLATLATTLAVPLLSHRLSFFCPFGFRTNIPHSM